jgi:serine/threonine protein kinase
MDHCLVCQRLLSEAAHALALEPDQERDTGEYNTMFRPQAQVGQRYRIVRFLARGGMGEVYEAYDCDLRERVALKTVTSTASDDPRAVRRLKAEVQLARRVSHPNVCRIYDLGIHVLEHSEAILHFLTMEFVDGEPLGQRLRTGGALPLEAAVSYARQLLAGLSAAHHAGILHRDLKSDNVILRTGSDGTVSPVILDFGLARSLDPDSKGLTSGTNQAFVGTLSYMAPEQIEGKQLSAASDLYAFGVLWFEMLTGMLPFGAESAAANALERLRKRPAVPSSVNPNVPKALDAIVLGCLGRHPEDRFESADDVIKELDAWERSPRPSKKPKRGMIVLGLAGALVAGWALLADASRDPVPELRRWQRPTAVVPRPAVGTAEKATPSPEEGPSESEIQMAAAAPPGSGPATEKAPTRSVPQSQRLPGRASLLATLPDRSMPKAPSSPGVGPHPPNEATDQEKGEEPAQLAFAGPPSVPSPPAKPPPPPEPAPPPPSPKGPVNRWENPFDEAVVRSPQPEQ